MHVGAAEFFGSHFLAGRGLHQRRPPQENRALPLDDHRFVAHRRNVSAAGRARTHHRGDLSDAFARHPRLIVKNAAEMVAVGKDLVLQRQERAAGIDEIDARQMILLGDLLRAQMLFDRHRIVRSALDGRVVGDDDAVLPFDDADAGDDSGGRRIRLRTCRTPRAPRVRGSRSGIDESFDPLASGEFVAAAMLFDRFRAAAGAHCDEPLAQLGD